VQMIIIAALGGAGTLYGPIIGAIILIPLQSATNTWLGGSGSGLTYVVYGGIIMLIARFEPGGVIELWTQLRRLGQKRGAPTAPAAEGSRAA
jgi:branched-chain amino acid transport system permease protein